MGDVVEVAGAGRPIKMDHLFFALRKDQPKYYRAKERHAGYKQIQEAKQRDSFRI